MTAMALVQDGDGGADRVADEPEAVGGTGSPLRRCIASGRVQPKDGLVRFVVGPGDMVVPDVAESLPGRGLWLTADPALVEKAASKGLFTKAARRAVKVPVDLPGQLAGLLRRRCLEMVGLARKGGAALAGFEKVHAALKTGRVGERAGIGVWLEARDGAADGRGKLAGLAALHGVTPVGLFDRTELGAALGRDAAVHVVLARGPLADGLLREARRLAALTGEDLAGPVGVDTSPPAEPGPETNATTRLSDRE